MGLATALAFGGLALQGFSMVRGARAQQQAGEASARVAESQAQLSEFNAKIAELQAKDALERGTLESNRYRSRVKTMIGTQRAGFAGQGVDVGFGSAVDVQVDTARIGELDALQIMTDARREAWGFTVEAQDARHRAEILRREGANAVEVGKANARTTLLSGSAGLLTGTSNLLSARYGFGEA